MTTMTLPQASHAHRTAEYEPGSAVYAGVFVAPNHTQARLFNSDGVPIGESAQVPTPSVPQEFIQSTARLLRSLCEQLGAKVRVTEVALAVAGEMDLYRSTIVRAGRLQKFTGYPITDRLMRALNGVTVIMGNDAEARAIWEAINNPDVDGRSFLAIYAGNGIGGAYGRPEGESFTITAIEPGHRKVRSPGRPMRCQCGEIDCLDAHCGGERFAENVFPKYRVDVDKWDRIVVPLTEILVELLNERPVEVLILGGAQVRSHPILVEFVRERLQGLLGLDCPDVVISTLPYAPVEAALTLLGLKLPA